MYKLGGRKLGSRTKGCFDFALVRVSRPYSYSIYPEIDTLNQRNKILKNEDHHWWDTVHANLDDPLTDSVEDVLNLQTAVFRASHKGSANKPYNKGGSRRGFNTRNFFVASSMDADQSMTTTVTQHNSQKQYRDELSFCCKKPGHTARFCSYKGVPSAVQSRIN
ncbi:unnamed protein product [Mytilus coruscus]|uniref:CCHC-type domain-containing protein n=1 Tax=Mytilus coruscus TaxID=42192 RepID=A0A6J8EKU5_MYTCO|nr:unnamed protein product [Mytilus coruscus]